MAPTKYNPKSPDTIPPAQDSGVIEFAQTGLPPDPPPQEIPIVPIPEGAMLEKGDFQSPNFRTGQAGWRLRSNGDFEGNDGTFRGNIQASSIDIPDATTANSFHVDSMGNTWWGGTTFANAIASISKAGQAFFQGMASLNKKAFTNFEGSGRFNNTPTAGTSIAPVYGNQGVTVSCTATATRYSRIIWYIANVFTNNPTFVATLVINAAPAGTGQVFIGMGQPSVDGTGHTFGSTRILGFELINILGGSLLSVRGNANDSAVSEQRTSTLTTVTTGDTLELFIRVNGTVATYYFRKNGGALSAGESITTSIPTSSSETSVQFSVSNQGVANDTSIILQSAAFEH